MEKTQYIIHVAAFICARGASIAAFVAAVPLFVARAGSGAYGVVAVGLSILGIGVLVDSSIGYVVAQSVGRRLARGKPIRQHVVNGLLTLYLSITAVVVIAAGTAICLQVENGAERTLYLTMIFSAPMIVVSAVVAAVSQAQNSLVYLNSSRAIGELGKAAALAIAAIQSEPIFYVGPLVLLGFSIRALVDTYMMRARSKLMLRLVSWKDARRLWRLAVHGGNSLGIVALSLLVLVGDKFLIKSLESPESVAYYSIAYELNTKLYVFVHATNAALFTMILRTRATYVGPWRHIRTGLSTVGVVILVVYLPIFLFSERILHLFFSDTFSRDAKELTSLMAIASSIYLLGNVMENSLTAMGKARSILPAYALGVAVYFLSLIPLHYTFGLAGFAYAYVAFMLVLATSFVATYFKSSKPTRQGARSRATGTV